VAQARVSDSRGLLHESPGDAFPESHYQAPKFPSNADSGTTFRSCCPQMTGIRFHGPTGWRQIRTTLSVALPQQQSRAQESFELPAQLFLVIQRSGAVPSAKLRMLRFE